MILEQIMAHKRREVAARRRAAPLELVEAAAKRCRQHLSEGCQGGGSENAVRDFAAALRAPGVSLIAEAKRASPSKGLLCADYHPAEMATTYAGNGAAAISVLTDETYFQGRLADLQDVRTALDAAGLARPVLRKDFVFDGYQVFESRAAGADALLLIVAALSYEELSTLLSLTRSLGMTALVEVHNGSEVRRALRAGARVVGINNRDLHDFSVDLGTFARLRRLLPRDAVAVAESGIRTGEDVRRLGRMGADAVLVGEAIVTAADVPSKVRELVHGGQA